ncbi:GDSL-type esterase/lipase family protein [Alicyclobacillus dauci]|uniref:GDSL-type esterase/lipase family protein n=1 Tax=Alicyclobacillus dauci TaxID=1475485 RepID=A0ABY6Z1A6_9BACL|nr:GDSL-type esterase/lipase family protein [Alicyclobacillus dauci]WAH36011.1 GDSL-type esterase/lipase family protein [Alicyclobacillus dauci]
MKASNRLWGSLVALSVVTAVTAPSVALAGTTDTPTASKGQLVALGDSITYGYNLGDNKAPSQQAFPYLIAEQQHLTTDDLGVPGWTSTDLLNALTNSSTMQTAVKNASVITIDIGSNDLLQTALTYGALHALDGSGTSDLADSLSSAVTKMGENVGQIVKRVKTLNPKAAVVLYNIYDPISSTDKTLYPVAEKAIGSGNVAISKVASQYHFPVADAYGALHNHPEDILANDVHPTVQGQAVLATQGEKALSILHVGQYLNSPQAWQSIWNWFKQFTHWGLNG